MITFNDLHVHCCRYASFTSSLLESCNLVWQQKQQIIFGTNAVMTGLMTATTWGITPEELCCLQGA